MAQSQSPTRPQSEQKSASSSQNAVRSPLEDLATYLRDYARQEPEVAACVCLGIGFILGWKLKPW